MRFTENRVVNFGFALAILILFTIGGVSYLNTVRLIEAERRQDEALEILARLSRLQSTMLDLQSAARGFALTGDEAFLEPYRAAEEAFGPLVAELAGMVRGNTEMERRLEELLPHLSERITFSREIIETRRRDGLEAAARMIQTGRGLEAMNRIRAGLARMSELERFMLTDSRYRTEGGALATRLAIIAGSTVAVFLMAVSLSIIRRQVAARQRADEALHKQTSVLQSILESMGDGVVVADETGAVLLFNPAAQEMFSTSTPDTPPETWPKRFGLHDGSGEDGIPCPPEMCPLVDAVEGRACDGVELTVARDGASTRWLSATARPLKGPEGTPRGGVVVFRDITEHKRAQAALQEREEELRQANEELSRGSEELATANRELEAFSYSVSHDLRAPLRALDGFSRILMEDYAEQLDGDAQRYLGIIRENSQMMGKLIDDLLAFSRVSRKAVEVRPVSPTALVREVLEELCAAEEGREIRTHVDELPPCEADPALLRQVWANLLSNALKYTRHRDVAEVEVGGRVEGDTAVYYVRDNGAGFDMQYVNKLFGVFQRLHRMEEFEGTGVGLAIVQRIVHRHGGRAWAEGAVDQGATFYFTLNLPEDDPGAQD